MDFAESLLDDGSDHFPDFFSNFHNGDIRGLSATENALDKFASNNTSIVPVALFSFLVNSLGVVEQLEVVSDVESKVLLEQSLASFVLESVSVVDLLDFLVASDAVNKFLRKGALVNLVFSDKSEVVVGGEVSNNVFEEVEGDLSSSFVEALDDGGGVAQVGLFEQSVQKVLKIDEGIIGGATDGLLGIDLLSNLTKKLTEGLVHTLDIIEVASACQLSKSLDVEGDVLNGLLFEEGERSARNVVSNEKFVSFRVISHASKSGRREALLEVLDMDGQVDDIVFGNILQEVTNEVHSQIGSVFIKAVDFLDGISDITLFPESSKNLVKTVLGVSGLRSSGSEIATEKLARAKSEKAESNNKSLHHLLTQRFLSLYYYLEAIVKF